MPFEPLLDIPIRFRPMRNGPKPIRHTSKRQKRNRR